MLKESELCWDLNPGPCILTMELEIVNWLGPLWKSYVMALGNEDSKAVPREQQSLSATFDHYRFLFRYPL